MLEYDFVGDTLHNRWLGVGRLLENHIPRAVLTHNIARLDNGSQECSHCLRPSHVLNKVCVEKGHFSPVFTPMGRIS